MFIKLVRDAEKKEIGMMTEANGGKEKEEEKIIRRSYEHSSWK